MGAHRGAALTMDPSRRELLALARSLRDDVRDDDPESVHRHLASLRSGLVEHVRLEREAGPAVDHDPVGFVVRNGQERLLALVDEVLAESSAETDALGCNCMVRSAEIEIALRRQDRLEGHRPTA